MYTGPKIIHIINILKCFAVGSVLLKNTILLYKKT